MTIGRVFQYPFRDSVSLYGTGHCHESKSFLYFEIRAVIYNIRVSFCLTAYSLLPSPLRMFKTVPKCFSVKLVQWRHAWGAFSNSSRPATYFLCQWYSRIIFRHICLIFFFFVRFYRFYAFVFWFVINLTINHYATLGWTSRSLIVIPTKARIGQIDAEIDMWHVHLPCAELWLP